jgi:hypothetical protein
MDEPCNSWPNRETCLAACWLFTRRYGELMHISRELWRTTRGRARDASVRRRLANHMRAMVVSAGNAIEALPTWRVHVICWDRLADHLLGGIADYRSGRDAT